jgi:hypothetical protein
MDETGTVQGFGGGGSTGGESEPSGIPPSVPLGIPWEQRDRLGFGDALVRTLKLSLFEPSAFFAQLPPHGPTPPTPPPPLGAVGSPILYAVVVGVPSTILGIFWQLVASSIGILGGDGDDALFDLGTSIFVACLSPIFIPVGLAIHSVVLHIFLLILGGAQRGLLATFRAACYATGPVLFQAIPLCGVLVSGIWVLVLTVVGLHVVHRTTLAKAFGAVALPLVCCCGFFLLTLMAGVFTAILHR